MQSIPVTSLSTVALEKSADSKLKKAGAQFEAILLNNVLGDLERAFTSLPGKPADNSSQAYRGFAMQALAGGLADKGGVGIGKLIERALTKHAGGNTVKTDPANVKGF